MRKTKTNISILEQVGELLEQFIQEKNNNKLIFGWAKLKSHYLGSKLRLKHSNSNMSLKNCGKVVQMAQNSKYIYQEVAVQQRLKSPFNQSIKSANSPSRINSKNRQILPTAHQDGFEEIILGRLSQLQSAISCVKQFSYANPSLADLLYENQSGVSYPSRIMNINDINTRNIRLNSISPPSINRGYHINFYSPTIKNDQSFDIQDTSMRIKTQHEDKQYKRTNHQMSIIEQLQQHRSKMKNLNTKNWQPRFFKSISNYNTKDLTKNQNYKRQHHREHSNINENILIDESLQSIKMKIQQAKKKINHQNTKIDYNKKAFMVQQNKKYKKQTDKPINVVQSFQINEKVSERQQHNNKKNVKKQIDMKIESYKIINIDYEAASALSPKVVKQQKKTFSIQISPKHQPTISNRIDQGQMYKSLQSNYTSPNKVKNLSRKQKSRQVLKMKK